MRSRRKLNIRAVALDLDGVVYEGDNVIAGAPATVRSLREKGIDVYFVTNNSGKKRASIAAKLGRMGIDAPPEHIITSGYTAAMLAERLSGSGKSRILLIGSEELEEEFQVLKSNVVRKLPADILVVGLDRTFNYDKLSLGLNALRRGAVFIACNRDRVFPVGDSQVLPGCGPLVAALEWAGNRKADYVAGKPAPIMLEMITRNRGVKAGEVLVVGDMLDSDIAMAGQCGCPSVLIASNNLPDSEDGSIRPDFYITSIAQLPAVIHENSQGEAAS